jgi:hypothetical protein
MDYPYSYNLKAIPYASYRAAERLEVSEYFVVDRGYRLFKP